MSIGRNIYDLRKSKHMTQGQLAEKLGVSEQAVSKWECDLCSPDVSLFPVMARLFGVSIDRIYGFCLSDSGNEAVTELLAAAEQSMDTRREIEILTEGLRRFPNSDRLKNSLAFSYAMVNRIAEREEERENAVKKSLALCREVIGFSGDLKEVDTALITMSRIFTESGRFDEALDAIQRMSAENYYGRIAYTAALLANKGDTNAQLTFVEESMFHCWLAMCHSLDGLIHSLLFTKKAPARALEFHHLYLRLLSLFDEGLSPSLAACGQVFYATAKMIAHERGAEIYRRLGDKEGCLTELEQFFALADPVRAVAKSAEFHLSKRNAYFTEAVNEDMEEEYMNEVFPERVLGKYAPFLDGEERFEKLYGI